MYKQSALKSRSRLAQTINPSVSCPLMNGALPVMAARPQCSGHHMVRHNDLSATDRRFLSRNVVHRVHLVIE